MTDTAPVQVPAASATMPIVVAAFYKFIAMTDLSARQAALQELCQEAGLLGTVLLADEGINATLSGTRAAMQILFDAFARDSLLADISPKFSFAASHGFHRMKVRLKTEIVSMGKSAIDPNQTGTYVRPEEWNALIADPDTLLIDTRNDYEVAIGSFEQAVNPKTTSFREFPDWVDGYLAHLPSDRQPKNIAMFCTGGIRCEKATAYLVGKGYENVFHLQGGILTYLEKIPPQDSQWQGDCFVFDQRVSVRHDLVPGNFDMCHACRMPLRRADKSHPAYESGVSCHHCIDKHDEAARARFRERQKQIKLARQRGQTHIGQ